MKTNRFDIQRMTRSNTGGGGGSTGGGGSYTLPLAADGVRGGVQVGYTTDASARKYAVQLDNEKMFVNVPWENTWRPLGNGANDACAGNDSRLSDARPASDVYSWAKAATKPSYNLDEVPDGNTRKLANYLPLSGGTMTGTLKVKTGYGISDATDNGLLVYHPVDWTGVTSSQWGVGATDCVGVIRSSNNPLVHYKEGTNYDIIDASGGAMASGVRLSFSGGNFYLGNSNNAGWLMVQDMCSQDAAGDSIWSIRTNGNCQFANVYSRGYVTALSDARKKRVMGDVVLSAEQIAAMPAVRFEWKDPEKPGTFIGTLAQNWREILPEAVHTLDDNTLSFDYQSAAIVALINLADEIVAIKNKLKRYGFK